jgi:hypothetical protein
MVPNCPGVADRSSGAQGKRRPHRRRINILPNRKPAAAATAIAVNGWRWIEAFERLADPCGLIDGIHARLHSLGGLRLDDIGSVVDGFFSAPPTSFYMTSRESKREALYFPVCQCQPDFEV